MDPYKKQGILMAVGIVVVFTLFVLLNETDIPPAILMTVGAVVVVADFILVKKLKQEMEDWEENKREQEERKKTKERRK
jgi:Ca2+/Na+ antiporter